MSYFPSSRQLLNPISRWRWPTYDVLEERQYKSGHPPFDYFPSVSTIVNFALCPVAGVHSLLYGVDDATIDPFLAIGAGKIFEGFIAFLKSMLIEESHPFSMHVIKGLYEEYTKGKAPEVREQCWNAYIRPWLTNNLLKLREEAKPGSKIYFGVRVLSKVLIEGGQCHYPLVGEIDEIDLHNKRIIERTIKDPPFLKDFQVWLYWKLLCSLPSKERPEIMQNEKFEEYELLVETPKEVISVKKDSPEFPKLAHDAFAWLHHISSRRGSLDIFQAFKEASKFCTNEQRWNGCTLHHRFCFVHGRRYPQARKIMHERLKNFYRYLLYEQMWNQHLFLYQQLELPLDRLAGKIAYGKLLSRDGNIFEVEIKDFTPIHEKEEEEDIYGFHVIFGNLKLGLLRKAMKEREDNGRLKIRVEEGGTPLSHEIHILVPKIAMFREEPWFLYSQRQRGMRRFELRGVDKEEKARRDALIQLVEGGFGFKKLLGSRE